jgi:outer membrane murein-binding lipoprotein Lpp
MPNVRMAGVAAIAVGAALLAGCDGEGNGEEAAVDEATAVAELHAAADRLCRDAQAEQEEIRRERGGAQVTLADRARLLVDLAPVRERLAADLGELDPPQGEARPFGRLVAAAERRGIASSAAGGRWRRGADREKVAAAVAREHDERGRFVELAGRLGLLECAEALPQPHVAAIAAAIEDGLTAAEPGRCEALGTRLLEELYGGGVEDCVAFGPPFPRARRVRVSDVEGMPQLFAVARVLTVREGAGERHRLRIVYEHGAYRIDKVD